MKEDKLLSIIEDNLGDCEEFKDNFNDLLKHYKRKNKRLDKIIKHSDTQHRMILQLNSELNRYKTKLEDIHDYNVQQQNIARKKVEASIVNELNNDNKIKVDIISVASDILSGDLYSIYKKKSGSILFYLIDGQDHGISPSLTVFSVSSIINRYAKEDIPLQELLNKVLPFIRNFLADEEQLSFSILELNSDFSKIEYSIGGMYPTLIYDGSEIKELKSNSLPILNFSTDMKVNELDIKNFKKIVVYSDGIVETIDDRLLEYSPRKMLFDSVLMEKARDNIPSLDRDDDITVLSISRIN